MADFNISPLSSETDFQHLRYWDRLGNVYLGDVIVGVNQIPVRSAIDLLAAFEQYKVGDRVTLTVIRDRRQKKIRGVAAN